MESPSSHNRATNIIGRVLDAKQKEDPRIMGPSLEASIAHALEAEGLLNDPDDIEPGSQTDRRPFKAGDQTWN